MTLGTSGAAFCRYVLLWVRSKSGLEGRLWPPTWVSLDTGSLPPLLISVLLFSFPLWRQPFVLWSWGETVVMGGNCGHPGYQPGRSPQVGIWGWDSFFFQWKQGMCGCQAEFSFPGFLQWDTPRPCLFLVWGFVTPAHTQKMVLTTVLLSHGEQELHLLRQVTSQAVHACNSQYRPGRFQEE